MTIWETTLKLAKRPTWQANLRVKTGRHHGDGASKRRHPCRGVPQGDHVSIRGVAWLKWSVRKMSFIIYSTLVAQNLFKEVSKTKYFQFLSVLSFLEHCDDAGRGSRTSEDRKMFILHCQYHSCWWPGDVRSQGIGSHGIDLFIPN